MLRGDIVLVDFPFPAGTGSKMRPGLVVQNDDNSSRLANTIIAAITSTTHRSGQPTQLLIAVSTPEGQQSGLLFDSVVTCENLATIDKQLIRRTIGKLPPATMDKVNDCLKASLGLS